MLDLYVDSAVREDVEPLLALGAFKGVTTNPTILHRAGLTGADLPEVYRWAAAAGAKEIFVQAWGDTTDDLVSSGQRLMQLGNLTVVKVAATRNGIRAGAQLATVGVPVLLTVVYAAHQAVTAAAIGAKYLAPYIGKMADDGRPAREETASMHRLLRATDSPTRVLAASVRNTADLVHLAEQGVDAFTLPVAVARKLFDDPSTASASAGFDEITATW
jgi:TalC/MipB family fructose-6-phosphate aldolase